MERAPINLISNAVEATTREDQVVVSLNTGDNRHIIRIKDCGRGTGQTGSRKYFYSFLYEQEFRHRDWNGYYKKVIEGQQGKLSIKSFLDQGTEVLVELPL